MLWYYLKITRYCGFCKSKKRKKEKLTDKILIGISSEFTISGKSEWGNENNSQSSCYCCITGGVPLKRMLGTQSLISLLPAVLQWCRVQFLVGVLLTMKGEVKIWQTFHRSVCWVGKNHTLIASGCPDFTVQLKTKRNVSYPAHEPT